MQRFAKICLSAISVGFAGIVLAAAPAAPDIYRDPYKNAYFGDLHIHTGLSLDSAVSGVVTTVDDAYNYAKGKPIRYQGKTIQRKVPLDFLAVTDHAEYLGVAAQILDKSGRFSDSKWDKYRNTMGMGKYSELFQVFRGKEAVPEFIADDVIKSNWTGVIAAAEKHYRPGTFTSIVGFEWSPFWDGIMMHRVALFRGPQYPEKTFSSLDSKYPEDLWTYAQALRDEGIDSLMIPHNSSLSAGLMFSYEDSFGKRMGKSYAARRALNEPLMEITQIKGTSETRPEFAADEFADFELLPANKRTSPKGGYAREGLKRGLMINEALGVNPYRYGFVGSSDFHSGAASTEEDNYPGSLGVADDMSRPKRVLNELNPIMKLPTTYLSVSGLTGVWAQSNTREDIFDALKRREVFATSGTRMQVRMFAGWRYNDDVIDKAQWLKQAYKLGVPMGADLPPAPKVKGAPKFIVQASKAPEGANLDRIQVVKVWLEDGKGKEKVFDAVWSGERARVKGGGIAAIKNTVDLTTASYKNSVGAVELKAVWQDPEFNPDLPAVYYARVLEIPTPRWPTYLSVRNALPLTDKTPASIQERAWTSPIFYAPETNRKGE